MNNLLTLRYMREIRGLFQACAAVAAFLVVACGDGTHAESVVTEGFPLYGPGGRWIDRVEAGTVRFTAVATVEIYVNGDHCLVP